MTGWIAAVLLWLAPSRYGRTARLSANSVQRTVPSPSLRAVRHALKRTDRPVHLLWIAIGTFTTAGVMLSMGALAVWTGHKVGLDFSAIERDDPSSSAIAPLVLLTLAVLAAFPMSGFLITKACNSESILEAAVAALIAILAVLVILGLADPVALLFALAFTPIALALSCVGGWFGLGR